MLTLELHPQEGIIYLALAGGSNPAGPYPYGVLTLPGYLSLYLTLPPLKYFFFISWVQFCVGAILRLPYVILSYACLLSRHFYTLLLKM